MRKQEFFFLGFFSACVLWAGMLILIGVTK